MDIPLWFIFAFLAAIFSGLNNFFKKVSVENKNDPKVVTFYFTSFATAVSGVFFYFFYENPMKYGLLFWGTVVAISIGQVVAIIFKMKGLKYLNASTFLIALRLGIIFLLFLVEIFIFKNSFGWTDVLGLIIGSVALFFMTDKKIHNKKQYLLGGFIAVVICMAVASISNTLKKNIAVMEYDKYAFYFFIFLGSWIISSIMNYKKIITGAIFKNTRGTIFYPSLQATSIFISQMFGFTALAHGANLAIYAKIFSYSLFVPIILSIIIYKEKVTLKKLAAFGLTIISLWLFL